MPTAQSRQQVAQLPALTGLRFVAALLVVLHHFAIYDRYGPPRTPLDAILGGGSAGVDFFFVLSGFILTYTYVDTEGQLRASRRDFWLARLARIYPIYLLAWVIAAPPFFWSNRSLQQALTTAFSSLTLIQSWFPQAWVTAWNAPSWSLSVEALFYLSFPFIALVIPRLLNRRHLYVALAACWFAAVAMPVLCDPTVLTTHGPLANTIGAQVAWRNPVVRLPEFLLGVILARLFVTRPARPPTLSPAIVSVAALTLSIIALTRTGSMPDVVLYTGILAPLCALLIYALAFDSGPLATFFALPAVVVLGEASYALYILHEPLWAWMTHDPGGLPASQDWRTLIFVLTYLGIALTLSVLSLRLVEQPARRAIRRAFS